MSLIWKEFRWRSLVSSAKAMGIGSYAIIAVLFGLLVAAIIVGYIGWSSASGTDVPVSGYVAMAIGVVFSVAVGAGLMALVFYSSRAGYDEPAKLISSDNDHPPE